MGLDVGSTTIKAVILDPDENILFEDYRRHHADITGAMASLLADAADALPGAKVRATVTGSAGLGTAEALVISRYLWASGAAMRQALTTTLSLAVAPR